MLFPPPTKCYISTSLFCAPVRPAARPLPPILFLPSCRILSAIHRPRRTASPRARSVLQGPFSGTILGRLPHVQAGGEAWGGCCLSSIGCRRGGWEPVCSASPTGLPGTGETGNFCAAPSSQTCTRPTREVQPADSSAEWEAATARTLN